MDASQPPVSTMVSLSSPTCSVHGNPEFTVTYAHENTGTKPIWALVRLWTDYCNGFIARAHNPQTPREKRPRGLPPTILADEWDEDALDLNDTELIKLNPGQTMSRSYTFSVDEKLNGFISSDMYKLEVKRKYVLRLHPRRWRWIFVNALPADVEGDDEIAGEYPSDTCL